MLRSDTVFCLRQPSYDYWPRVDLNHYTCANLHIPHVPASYPTTEFKYRHEYVLSMPGKLKMSISGDNPVEHVRQILSQYSDDGSVDTVTVEITISDSTPVPTQSTIDEEQGTEEMVDQKRERGDIRSSTSHHYVLAEVAEESNMGSTFVTGKDIKNSVEGVNESSVYPALTQLWERKMLDRERVDDVANPYYRYYLTEHGKQTLESLGEPERTKGE